MVTKHKKKTALWKDVCRSISHSKGRFVSIMLLMALGCFALVGLFVTDPDMRTTSEAFFDEYSLADLTVMSGYGLDDNDVAALRGVEGAADVEYGYFKDVTLSGTTKAVRIQSAPEHVSMLEIKDGRMPQKKGEIAINVNLAEDYPLGSQVTVEEKANALNDKTCLRDVTYTVVGYVNSPDIVSIVNMGQSTAGTGTLKGYAVVTPDEFDSEIYMTARMTFDDLAGVDPYSNNYRDLVQVHKDQVEKLIEDRPAERLADIRTDAQASIDDGQAQVDGAKDQLADAKQKLDDAKSTLDDGAAQLADGKQQIADSEKTLTDAKGQLVDGQSQLDAAWSQLEAGRVRLVEGKATLDATWPQLVSRREKLEQGEQAYEANTKLLADGKATFESALASREMDATDSFYNRDVDQDGIEDGGYNGMKQQVEAAYTKFLDEDMGLTPGVGPDGGYTKAHKVLNEAKAQADGTRAGALKMIDDTRTAAQAVLDNPDASEADKDEAHATISALDARTTQVEAAYQSFLECDLNQDGVEDGGYNAADKKLEAGKSQADTARAVALGKLETGKRQFETTLDQQVSVAKDSFYNHDLNQDGAEDGGYNAAAAVLAATKATLDDGQAKYAAGMVTYNEGMTNYRVGSASYYANLATWRDSQTTLMGKYREYVSGQAKLAEAKQTLAEKLAEYNDGLAEYNEGLADYNGMLPDVQQKIADGEAELTDARARLGKLALPTYEADTRREALGSESYRTYFSISNIVDSLARVFPVFLYLVAAFVTFSTMTRMVDEERINSGTLKALGYHDGDVALKFVLYGALAGGIGAVVGIALGHTLLPYIVYSAYSGKFTIPPIQLDFYPLYTVVALVLAALASVLPAALAVRHELGEKPATLLLPKPPRGGSKILLERVRPVWRRMSFTHKVTARNLFRYKQRMFMTVLGVAGATCMLVAGFGVQHSIQALGERQFGQILRYDMIVAQLPTATDEQLADLDKHLDAADVASHVPLHYESVSLVAGANDDTQEISLLVPQSVEDLSAYVQLCERRSGRTLSLGDDGAVVSERLANILGIGVGDMLEFKAADGSSRSVRVSGVTEMYMGHFIFMSPAAYERCLGQDYAANAALVRLNDSSLDSVESRSSAFMKLPAVKSVVQNTALEGKVNTIVASLNKIMGVLIVVATMLAIVIMYNLTNLNVSERMRELSTIKVLGFHSNETTMYIYRETILLTALGLLAGYVLGVALHEYIMTVVPPDNVMFNPAVAPIEFIVPAVVIGIITAMLYVVELRRLSTVDMLEALKSVE